MARILLIEDEKEIVEIMKMLLEHGDHEVVTALDGEEGLEMALREYPDLILLDVLLPKMDGIALNARLLKHEKTRRIPVVVITTQSATDNNLSEAENVKLYLQKPFDVMTLLNKIKIVLDSSRKKR